MFGAEHTGTEGHEFSEHVAGLGLLAGFAGPAGEFVPGAQGAVVMRSRDTLPGGEQVAQEIDGAGRVAGITGSQAEFVPEIESVVVFGSADLFELGEEFGEQCRGPLVIAGFSDPAGVVAPAMEVGDLRRVGTQPSQETRNRVFDHIDHGDEILWPLVIGIGYVQVGVGRRIE